MGDSAPLDALRVADGDDVAVALRELPAGTLARVADQEISVNATIARGHKFALRDLPAGADVRKFGWPIGVASQAIARGDWVHTHNLRTRLSGQESYVYDGSRGEVLDTAPAATFDGYRRADGRVGTRNEIWVLCTVGCVANTARRIAEEGARRHAGRVDGIHAFTHPFGCSQLGDDLAHTRRMLAALATHPNVGGVLLVGLGCESLQLGSLLAELTSRDRVRSFNAQQAEDELERGLDELAALVELAARDRREPCPLSTLTVGLKCGGSDGFSGITANPLLGRVADLLGAAGGTPVLTEIPEIFGAEQLLMRRATERAVFDDIARVVNDFKQYFLDHHQPVHENPSPGNIAGGITTLEEKSLGAVQKGGRGPVTQVLRYGEQARKPGLALLEAPGNDAVSSTALVAAGCTVLLFTTGRGTPLGFPAPTLKIASNGALARAKPRWIDYDAGAIVEGKSMDEAAQELLRLVLDTASGRPARHEINGEREIALWKTGVTL